MAILLALTTVDYITLFVPGDPILRVDQFCVLGFESHRGTVFWENASQLFQYFWHIRDPPGWSWSLSLSSSTDYLPANQHCNQLLFNRTSVTVQCLPDYQLNQCDKQTSSVNNLLRVWQHLFSLSPVLTQPASASTSMCTHPPQMDAVSVTWDDYSPGGHWHCSSEPFHCHLLAHPFAPSSLNQDLLYYHLYCL